MDYSAAEFDTFVKVPIQSPGMGTKKRKPAKGPFYFFMMDKKTEWIQEGKLTDNCSMKRLVEDCRPLWKLMKSNPCLMEPYIERARLWKQEQNKDLENVYDSMGRSLADIRREAQRVKEKHEKMQEEIEIAVKTSGNVVSKKFHVAYFNYLCQTRQDFFVPCEASVVKFSIDGGIIKV